jgi:hypothetical protein
MTLILYLNKICRQILVQSLTDHLSTFHEGVFRQAGIGRWLRIIGRVCHV